MPVGVPSVSTPSVTSRFGIDLARGGLLGDRAVHRGLGEGRLVALVVAVAAVAEDVHHHVLP